MLWIQFIYSVLDISFYLVWVYREIMFWSSLTLPYQHQGPVYQHNDSHHTLLQMQHKNDLVCTSVIGMTSPHCGSWEKKEYFCGLGLLSLRACQKSPIVFLFWLIRLLPPQFRHHLRQGAWLYPGGEFYSRFSKERENGQGLVKWLHSVLKTEQHRASRLLVTKTSKKVETKLTRSATSSSCWCCHCNPKGCKWAWQKDINSQSCTFQALPHSCHLSLAQGTRWQYALHAMSRALA